MNKIYLLFNKKYIFIILHFIDNNNHFYINDEFYNFEIINKNKLKTIDKNKDITYFYTNDSFLYYENIHLKNFIYKINLIYNNSIENVIINFKNNKIILFSIKKEGLFKLDKDILIITWQIDNNSLIKEEVFIKHDDINFLINNYQNRINSNVNSDIINKNKTNIYKYIKKHNTYIFIHVCFSENGIKIMNEQINTILQSDIYNYIDKIYLCIVGAENNDEVKKNFLYDNDKIEIYYIDSNKYVFELRTINEIQIFCGEKYKLNEECYILYIHTKGVRNAGNYNVIKSWRKMMEYFLIVKGIICLEELENYDTIGNNLINQNCENFDKVCVNKKHSYHYSGNFWWSKSSYIQTLDKLDLSNIKLDKEYIYRYKAENWILSSVKLFKAGILYQDYTNLHPYHRYIFEDYKYYDIFVKNILLF